MAWLNLIKRQKILTGLILLCAMWSITFVYVMRKDTVKKHQIKDLESNSSSVHEAQLVELEHQVEKVTCFFSAPLYLQVTI